MVLDFSLALSVRTLTDAYVLLRGELLTLVYPKLVLVRQELIMNEPSCTCFLFHVSIAKLER